MKNKGAGKDVILTPIISTIPREKELKTFLDKPLKIKKVKDAKRLLSRIIYEFSKGELNSQFAKDLCYMLNVYVQTCNTLELSEKLDKLKSEIQQIKETKQ